MSTRCAVCGSKNVVTETKKEGYNLKKGAIGTALFGMFGALAGTDGKETVYYHCADCGQVMNKPMSSWKSDMIDMYMRDPQRWASHLKEEKETYKNIEWNENNKVSGNSDSRIDKIYDSLLKENLLKAQIFLIHAYEYRNQSCTCAEAIGRAKELDLDMGQCEVRELIPYYKEMEAQGLFKVEPKDKKNYYSIGDLNIYDIRKKYDNVITQLDLYEKSEEYRLLNNDDFAMYEKQKQHIQRAMEKLKIYSFMETNHKELDIMDAKRWIENMEYYLSTGKWKCFPSY